MEFYLNALAEAPGSDRTASVRVPDGSRVRAILEPLYTHGLAEGRLFSGADLEAAVNEAYIRSMRVAIPPHGWVHGTFEDVALTEEVLAESLAAGPRSVQPDSIERFLSDADRYCGRDVEASMRARFMTETAINRNGQPNGSKLFRGIRRRLPRPVGRSRG